MRKNMKAIYIAICGPSASGKTFIVEALAKKFGKGNTLILSQDRYYRDWSKLSVKKREMINFDHPNAFDFDLMIEQIKGLKNGQVIKAPVYSYKLHKRLKKVDRFEGKKVIIIEGLFTLYKYSFRKLFDHCFYIDINPGVALARRIKRDVNERGRCLEEVCGRFLNDVLPMQEKYVESQKKYADFVVDGSDSIKSLVSEITDYLSFQGK